MSGRLEIVKLLLSLPGIDINKQNILGQTVLLESCKLHFIEIAKLLIDNGANVDIEDKNGKTALSFETDPELRKCLLPPQKAQKQLKIKIIKSKKNMENIFLDSHFEASFCYGPNRNDSLLASVSDKDQGQIDVKLLKNIDEDLQTMVTVLLPKKELVAKFSWSPFSDLELIVVTQTSNLYLIQLDEKNSSKITKLADKIKGAMWIRALFPSILVEWEDKARLLKANYLDLAFDTPRETLLYVVDELGSTSKSFRDWFQQSCDDLRSLISESQQSTSKKGNKKIMTMIGEMQEQWNSLHSFLEDKQKQLIEIEQTGIYDLEEEFQIKDSKDSTTEFQPIIVDKKQQSTTTTSSQPQTQKPSNNIAQPTSSSTATMILKKTHSNNSSSVDSASSNQSSPQFPLKQSTATPTPNSQSNTPSTNRKDSRRNSGNHTQQTLHIPVVPVDIEITPADQTSSSATTNSSTTNNGNTSTSTTTERNRTSSKGNVFLPTPSAATTIPKPTPTQQWNQVQDKLPTDLVKSVKDAVELGKSPEGTRLVNPEVILSASSGSIKKEHSTEDSKITTPSSSTTTTANDSTKPSIFAPVDSSKPSIFAPQTTTTDSTKTSIFAPTDSAKSIFAPQTSTTTTATDSTKPSIFAPTDSTKPSIFAPQTTTTDSTKTSIFAPTDSAKSIFAPQTTTTDSTKTSIFAPQTTTTDSTKPAASTSIFSASTGASLFAAPSGTSIFAPQTNSTTPSIFGGTTLVPPSNPSSIFAPQTTTSAKKEDPKPTLTTTTTTTESTDKPAINPTKKQARTSEPEKTSLTTEKPIEKAVPASADSTKTTTTTSTTTTTTTAPETPSKSSSTTSLFGSNFAAFGSSSSNLSNLPAAAFATTPFGTGNTANIFGTAPNFGSGSNLFGSGSTPAFTIGSSYKKDNDDEDDDEEDEEDEEEDEEDEDEEGDEYDKQD